MERRFLCFDHEIGHGLTVDEVALDDPLQVLGCAGVIPNGIGIDDGHRAAGADSEAVGLGSMDKCLGPAKL